MRINSFDDREIEILIMALRYWRAQRRQTTRRTDPPATAETIDLLLAKLGYSVASTLPAEHFPDDFPRDFFLR